MEVGGQRETRVARAGDDVAAPHLLSLADVDLRQVAVRGFVAVAVVDDHRAARGRVAFQHVAHRAVGRGEYARPLGDGVVDALVRLERLVERVEAHAVGGCQQGKLFVDDGLDGRYVVACRPGRIDQRLQVVVGVVEFFEPPFQFFGALPQVAFELARRVLDECFVAGVFAASDFGFRFVGVRLEEDAEHVAVAFREVVQHHRQRIVACRQRLVFVAQPVGRVLEHVFERRVEEERESRVVDHRHTRPHEELHRPADDALAAALVPAEFFKVFFAGHGYMISKFVSRIRSMNRSYSS